MTARLADSAASVLERRTSRRGFLARMALAGSAMVVAPLRYLLRPGTAWAVIRPHACTRGLCTDGYTAFCCQINAGVNACPANTFIGGWWMCTAYAGRALCAPEGVRYYIDCNRIPGVSFGNGCRCAHNDCAERRVNCNVFRYGQCNTQIPGTTEVVCRVVVCQNPSTIEGFNCSASVAVDDHTCTHEARCLNADAPVVQLPGAGGV